MGILTIDQIMNGDNMTAQFELRKQILIEREKGCDDAEAFVKYRLVGYETLAVNELINGTVYGVGKMDSGAYICWQMNDNWIDTAFFVEMLIEEVREVHTTFTQIERG